MVLYILSGIPNVPVNFSGGACCAWRLGAMPKTMTTHKIKRVTLNNTTTRLILKPRNLGMLDISSRSPVLSNQEQNGKNKKAPQPFGCGALKLDVQLFSIVDSQDTVYLYPTVPSRVYLPTFLQFPTR